MYHISHLSQSLIYEYIVHETFFFFIVNIRGMRVFILSMMTHRNFDKSCMKINLFFSPFLLFIFKE